MDNFIVSARKYRPADFVSVVGQNHITSTLKNAISRNHLAHAYLFCGMRGVGKTTCARIFAKAINCLSPVDSEACNNCESCVAFDEGRSFNIHELDAASNNSVDDVRSLIDQVRIPPQIGRYSVYIIDEVHMLSAQAFNAFLKTLEEPPAHAIFILATTEKHKIIPTILSRCQTYDFNRIRVEDGVGYLQYIATQEGITYDDESLNLIAQKADGGMRDALSMFDKAVSFCGNSLQFKDVAKILNVLDYDTYFGITDLILANDYAQALLVLDNILRKGFSAQTFVTGLNNHFRDLMMCKNSQTAPLLEVTGSLMGRYRQQAEICSVDFLFNGISILTRVEMDFRTTLNQRLNVELGLMKLCGLGQKKNEDIEHSYPLAELQKMEETQLPQSPKPIDTAQTKPKTEPVASETRSELISPSQPEPIAAPHYGSSISGRSIADLMTAPRKNGTSSDGQQETLAIIDPDSEDKIKRFADHFFRSLQAERPRIAPFFHDWKVHGNHITIDVPSKELRDEILRNKSEITALLTAVAAVTGIVDIQIDIKEDTGALKPVKADDKFKFLADKNQAVIALSKALDLDIE